MSTQTVIKHALDQGDRVLAHYGDIPVMGTVERRSVHAGVIIVRFDDDAPVKPGALVPYLERHLTPAPVVAA